MTVQAKFPQCFKGFFKPNRYKIAYGGRGSGKSWAAARALLLLGSSKPLRIMCAREIQKSIKQSVHTLLNDQIQALGLGDFYQVLETEIRGSNGTQFNFAGLAQHTVESIKSIEGCDIVWVEEGQTVSQKSWDILIPTIRKPNSEIWVTFNPDVDNDDTYQRFVVNPPPDALVVKMNYNDNPWFPIELENERLHCLKTRSKSDYQNIWEGKCKAAVDGAIYAEEMESAQTEGRICNVPYDPMLKVQVVFDLGWNDSMFISLVQKGAADLRIIETIEDSHKTLDYYSNLLKEKKYNWGKVWLPHDGFNRDFKTGKSSQDILKALGWDVPSREEIMELRIEEGIRVARMTFNRIYFDKVKAKSLITSLKRYKRVINARTGEAGSPDHDGASHGADCFRYICINADKFKNVKRETTYIRQHLASDSAAGY